MDKYFNELIDYIERTDSKYRQLYEPNLPVHPIPFFGNITTELIDFGLVTKDAYNLKLTDRGRMLCSQVTSKFLETLPTDRN